ncbi:hypothetical protein DUI87_05871 [Hirundo rustica rustica]|uniref:Kinase D-interacting substrate of 220 kDa-like SAM domain-containing protein n=1 Tax=Hirundo rustica rustica TaxID=333673 RepID=A0A3M0L2U7_HIRRU|nr:hypothetical protein DUI87_05871 [Hirundo rustica rustica]
MDQNIDVKRGAGAGTGSATGVSYVSLSTMSVEAVCEKLKQIDGLDQSMLPQYSATIKKANINGRVLAQCNIDELKKEMNMNFGDWHLFRSMILEMRNSENQAAQEDARGATEHGTSAIPHSELTRRPGHSTELPHTELTGLAGQAPYTLNFSFEELNTIGLDEAPPRHSNLSWQSQTRRTPSLSSLNSQDSSIEISKLTDKVQAEYRDAYREYIAQMSQLEGGASSTTKLPSDEDESGTEESDNTPLLKEGKDKKTDIKIEKQPKSPEHGSEPIRTFIKAKEYLTDALLDKKDSSDSGVRSNESSPNHSLHNEGADDSQLEKANLIELEDDSHSAKRGIPHSLSGLQDPAVVRMSICSEDKKSPSESSLIASSPEESWPACQKAYNLNRTPSTVTLNNNSAPSNRANQNFEEIQGIRDPSQIILHPGSGSNSTAVQNENLKTAAHKRGQRSSYTRLSKDSSELHTVAASEGAGFGEERESIL